MKALIAYGTKYGSTARVAEEMGRVLAEKGAEITLMDLRRSDHHAMEDFDLIVVGSCINMHNWTKRARRFLMENSTALSKRNLAMFACCIDIVLFPSKKEQLEKEYVKDVAAEFGIDKVMSMRLFGGEVDLSRYGFFDATLAKSYIRNEKNEVRLQESKDRLNFQDWKEIRDWAASLAMMILR
ncbi:MAG: flavodoxin domain-containing protein [Methanomassiliicoccales archaeon]